MIRPPISIIIVQYNNSQDTIRCLEFVKESDYLNYNVIIVDNASEVKDLNSVRLFIESNNDKRGVLIESEENLGYAGGNNLGIKYALKNGAQYVLVLNPDVTLKKDTLSRLVEEAESDRKIGILGPAIDEGSGKIVCGGKIKFYQSELCHTKCSDLPDSRFQILDSKFYVPGACMLISKSVLELVGTFDERYFLYFEDADLCIRTRRAGWKLKVLSDVVVRHTPLSSTKALGSPLLLRYHYRNAHLFVFKNELCLCKFIFLPLWSFWIIMKQLIKIALGRNQEISRAILAGVGDFYKRRFGKINPKFK